MSFSHRIGRLPHAAGVEVATAEQDTRPNGLMLCRNVFDALDSTDAQQTARLTNSGRLQLQAQLGRRQTVGMGRPCRRGNVPTVTNHTASISRMRLVTTAASPTPIDVPAGVQQQFPMLRDYELIQLTSRVTPGGGGVELDYRNRSEAEADVVRAWDSDSRLSRLLRAFGDQMSVAAFHQDGTNNEIVRRWCETTITNPTAVPIAMTVINDVDFRRLVPFTHSVLHGGDSMKLAEGWPFKDERDPSVLGFDKDKGRHTVSAPKGLPRVVYRGRWVPARCVAELQGEEQQGEDDDEGSGGEGEDDEVEEVEEMEEMEEA